MTNLMANASDLPGTTSTSDLADEYLHWAQHRKGLRPLTILMYRNTLTHLCRLVPTVDDLVALTPEDVENFAHRPLRKGGVPAKNTARREIVSVSKFMQWCAGRKKIPCFGHLTAIAPKSPEGRPKPVSDDRWVAIWNSPTVAPDDRLWLGLMFFGGLRRFEVVTIRPEEVDIERQRLDFERKGGKYDGVDYLAMAASHAQALPWLANGWREWIDLLEGQSVARRGERHLCVYSTADDPFLDGNRLSKRLGVVLDKAGLAKDLFTCHQLRHACATNLFRCGWSAAEVQKALGHSSYNVTKGYMDIAGSQRARLKAEGFLP
jgi:site-specific recombinase XerD